MKTMENRTILRVFILLIAGALAYVPSVAYPYSVDPSWPEPGAPGQPTQIPGHHTDQVIAELRLDQPEVRQTSHWSQKLESFDTGPTGEGDNFTSAWFSLNIGSCPEDPACGFTQAGLLNNKEGMHWFVYSHLPLTCVNGREIWSGKGCVGRLDELFGEEEFHGLTPNAVVHFIRANQGHWEVQIQPPPGLKDPTPPRYTVAFARGTGKEEVTQATSTFESVYEDNGEHPKTEGHYIHYRPEYLKEGKMFEWPASDATSNETSINNVSTYSTVNHIFTFSTNGSFCPEIYSSGGYDPEFDFWVTGSNGGAGQCNEDRLF